MNDQQFNKFLKTLNLVLEQRLSPIEEKLSSIDSRVSKLEGNIDWIMGALDTDEEERLALGFNFDRKASTHL